MSHDLPTPVFKMCTIFERPQSGHLKKKKAHIRIKTIKIEGKSHLKKKKIPGNLWQLIAFAAFTCPLKVSEDPTDTLYVVRKSSSVELLPTKC